MNKKQMHGFIDPISIGFILAITGTLTALNVHTPSEQNNMQASVKMTQVVDQTPVKVN